MKLICLINTSWNFAK